MCETYINVEISHKNSILREWRSKSSVGMINQIECTKDFVNKFLEDSIIKTNDCFELGKHEMANASGSQEDVQGEDKDFLTEVVNKVVHSEEIFRLKRNHKRKNIEKKRMKRV